MDYRDNRPASPRESLLHAIWGPAWTPIYIYVDDMTMTGQFATRAMQQKARRIIGDYRLRAHKNKVFSPRQPRIVTGVAITARGHEVPNRRAKAIVNATAGVDSAQTSAEKLRLLPQLIGR